MTDQASDPAATDRTRTDRTGTDPTRTDRTGTDPTRTDPDLYSVVFENDRVRVLRYRDRPGEGTSPHRHPDSVMVTLSAFSRTLRHGDREVEVQLPAFEVRWLDAQEHSGTNTGATDTHTVFVELKEPRPAGAADAARLGPSPS